MFYVLAVGAIVTLIAINENLGDLSRKVSVLKNILEKPTAVEIEEARRRLVTQGFDSFETPEQNTVDSNREPRAGAVSGVAQAGEDDSQMVTANDPPPRELVIITLMLVVAVLIALVVYFDAMLPA